MFRISCFFRRRRPPLSYNRRMPKSPEKRGRWQFGLRSFSFFTVLAGPLLGWIGMQVTEWYDLESMDQRIPPGRYRLPIELYIPRTRPADGFEWPNEGQPQGEIDAAPRPSLMID